MTRPAAARTGGRPTATGTAGRGAARRAVALVPLLAGALLVTGPWPGTAQAAPAGSLGAPDDAAASDRPVRIDVARFEPRTVTPGSIITVTGTLTNTGGDTISDLAVRLQRGAVRTTRDELDEAVENPDPATLERAPFGVVAGELAPGATTAFSYSVPSDQLELDRDGVYPALLNVNGTVDGDREQRVGELSTFLVQQPLMPAARTAVAWMWPLSEPSHRTASGGFADDGLTASIGQGGRLDRVLAVVERLPVSATPGSAVPAPAVGVTLAIDPALVEELSIMADGPYAVAGEEDAGTGTDEARAFLGRLRALADVHPVVALPYGDVDADSLTAAGLADVVTRTLPGSPQGTAQDPTGADPGRTAPADGAVPPAEAAPRTTGAGAEILTRELGVPPVTDLAWAPDGAFTGATLQTLRHGGIDRVVLAGSALTEGASAVGSDGSDAVAHTTLPAGDGQLQVLVVDPGLADVVAGAQDATGGPRMAEQRYLAELAALTLQAPPGTEQTVLVAPPRDVRAGLEGAGAMMADATALPWLRPETVEGLGSVPPAYAGELAEPDGRRRLDAEGMATLAQAVALRNDLAGAVAGDPAPALQAQDAGMARSASVHWRGDPEGFRAAAAEARTSIDRLRERITVVAPADGTYSLASSDAPLVLTVDNGLPFPVEVLLQVRTRGNRGLSIGDIGLQVLAPGQRTTLPVPSQVQQSGGFAVTAEVTTPSGTPLGDRVDMQVRSTVYGPISLSITIGAASLLGLLFLRRLVNLLRRRRTATQGAGESPAAGLAAPPARSPV